MNDVVPSDLILGAIGTFVECSQCHVSLHSDDSLAIYLTCMNTNVEPVNKKNFAGNGIPYLQAIMQYPGIWADGTVGNWETLNDRRGFVEDKRIAAAGLYSLTAASRRICVSILQTDGRLFSVEKTPVQEYQIYYSDLSDVRPFSTRIEADFATVSFASSPSDLMRLATRLRDFSCRKGIRATLQDLRNGSATYGFEYRL